jgi:hypothetical protein
MSTTYAVKVDRTHPYFNDPEAVQFLAEHEDPGVPYRKLQGFPVLGNASLVQRVDSGDWQHVNGLDLQCIDMRAKHEIMKDHLYGRGMDGWIRCTCGWRADVYDLGNHSRVEAQAEKHMAEVDARVSRFRELLRYVRRTPEQDSCLHANDESRVHHRDPSKKEWHCQDCGLYLMFDLEIAS